MKQTLIFCLIVSLLSSACNRNLTDEDDSTESLSSTESSSTVEHPSSKELDDTDRVPVLLSIHMETSESIPCDSGHKRCKTDEEFGEMMIILERLIETLNATGLKGTFEHQITWLIRLEQSERGRSLIQAMIEEGHEIALHHHGFDHNDWDGYSNNPESNDHSMEEYMNIVHDFEKEWGIQITTMEGTDLSFDGQEEWIFHTSDDQQNQYKVELKDPEGYCPVGRPTWSVVSLPNKARELSSMNVINFGHTFFGGNFAQAKPDCTKVLSENILARIAEINLDDLETNEFLNFVFHPTDYGKSEENTQIYDKFFMTLGSMEELIGMTVQDFTCKRLKVCDFTR